MSLEGSITSDEEDTYKEESPCGRWHRRNVKVNLTLKLNLFVLPYTVNDVTYHITMNVYVFLTKIIFHTVS